MCLRGGLVATVRGMTKSVYLERSGAMLANENPLRGLLPSAVPENEMSSGTALWGLIHGPFPPLRGELHVNSLLEPASGDGMIYIPQSRQGLDFSQVLRSRCWQGRWAHGEAAGLSSPVSAPHQDPCCRPALRPARTDFIFSFIQGK